MQLLGDLSLFDGENATVATDTELVRFRAEGVMYDGADCPDLLEYVPSLRMTGAAQMGDLLWFCRKFWWRLRVLSQSFWAFPSVRNEAMLCGQT